MTRGGDHVEYRKKGEARRDLGRAIGDEGQAAELEEQRVLGLGLGVLELREDVPKGRDDIVWRFRDAQSVATWARVKLSRRQAVMRRTCIELDLYARVGAWAIAASSETRTMKKEQTLDALDDRLRKMLSFSLPV
jgi:hypothetical protein